MAEEVTGELLLPCIKGEDVEIFDMAMAGNFGTRPDMG